MAYQPVDIGTVANDGTGDPIRDAFDKVNDNFVEVYAGLVGLLDFKGSTDCSANPNYPAASKGDYYLVSVAGKIGGASGTVVSAGDSYFALADNAGGTQASVGTSWTVIEGNLGFAPVNKAGDTMTGDLIVPDEAYDATAWNGSLEVPTKNAVRDKIESLAGGVTTLDGLTDVNAPTPSNNDVLTWDSTPGEWVAAAPSGGSFTTASTTEILTGTDNSKGGTPDSIAALWEQGSDVASAGTTSLGEGGYFNITGTTTITDIDFATDKAGRKAYVKFAGILTLTHNASTLILPTGANITTAAGDTACFISEGSDVVRCVAYQRANGAKLQTFRGALVKKSADQTGANFTTVTDVTWNDETGGYDTDSFHDTVTNNHLFTIPSGVSKVRLQAHLRINNQTADTWLYAGIRKGGTVSFLGGSEVNTEIGAADYNLTLCTAVIAVSPGDTFSVCLQTESDTSIDITAARSWFSIEVIE